MDRSRRTGMQYFSATLREVCSDWPIYAAAVLYVACGYIFVTGMEQTAFGMLGSYLWAWSINFGVVGPFFVASIGVTHIILRLNKRRALAYRAMFSPERVARFIAGTVVLLTAVLLFTTMFSSIKTSLTVGRGFIFDVAQADIDKAIHFGLDPFRWLYAVAEHPAVLKLVEMNYNVIWFVLCYFTLYWVATSPRAAKFRIRYILTWFLSWIIVGNLMAGYWLSAGPAFYGFVTGDTARFADQLAFLATTAGEKNSAFNFQAYLWHLHETGAFGIGSGISAFPSVHVAVVTMNALFISEISRRLAPFVWVYVALVMASSVYLGWHYAIDGYVSLVTVIAIYWALRKFMPVAARLRWKTPASVVPEPVVQNS